MGSLGWRSRGAFAAVACGTVAVAASGALVLGLLGAGPAKAYTGAAFVHIPGILKGGSKGFEGWLRIESHYWKSLDTGGILGTIRNRRVSSKVPLFSGPPVANGASETLVISLDKRSGALPALMAACAERATLPEVAFAESSVLERNRFEFGPRPQSIPEYFEYNLKNVTISECPVLKEAPEQAFVLSVKSVEWTNYSGPADGQPIGLNPAALDPVPTSGVTRTFVIHWLGVAHDVSDDQCPKMNLRPTEDDYYALMSPEAAAAEKAALVAKGGVGYENGLMGRRGPGKLNVCFVPGIVPDPGFAEPQTEIARGIDLDGDRGTGKVGANVCRHRNYRADDGRAGIDNQLFRVQGCMQGYQGHKGFMQQYLNEQRRNGALSIMVQIAGIDDPRNDDHVQVALLYSHDPMAKDAGGKVILGEYTFRLTSDPHYAHYFTKLRGRIVNGAIVTDQVPKLEFRPHANAETKLYQAAFHLRILPDGSLKGVIGGYEDWHDILSANANSNAESLQGFQCPGLYYALKRNADGLKDPVTGQCNGISAAYDVEGVPAFIPPAQTRSQTVRLKK